MEHYKIFKLLNDSTVSKFVTKKLTEVSHISGCQYSANKTIRFKTSILRSDLCDYSYAYIFVEGRTAATGTNAANKRTKKITFNNNASHRSSISKINSTIIDAEHLDMVILMYNLLDYSDNYSITSESCRIITDMK